MSTIVKWPDDIPFSFPVDGFNEKAPDILIKRNMQVGPPKTRPRFTTGHAIINGYVIMTTEEVDKFETFFRDWLLDGHYEFEAIHPRVQQAARMKYIVPPKITSYGYLISKVIMQIKVYEIYVSGAWESGFDNGFA